MSVKVVATYIGKIGDVGLCDGMLSRNYRIADYQIFKVLTEDMDLRFVLLSANLVLVGHFGKRGR